MGRGRRDDDELIPDEVGLTHEEEATRRLLARYGEPRSAAPPASLAQRTIEVLPQHMPFLAGTTHRRVTGLRLIYTWIIAVGSLFVLGLGAWGVLVDSGGPARVFGSRGALGDLIQILTLAAKPLVNLLVGIGPFGLLGMVAIAGFGTLWWQLVRGVDAVPLEASV